MTWILKNKNGYYYKSGMDIIPLNFTNVKSSASQKEACRFEQKTNAELTKNCLNASFVKANAEEYKVIKLKSPEDSESLLPQVDTVFYDDVFGIPHLVCKVNKDPKNSSEYEIWTACSANKNYYWGSDKDWRTFLNKGRIKILWERDQNDLDC
jgi:hypothetical protein